MKVCEIFHSIQGEGSSVGQNVIFIRLSGCNLKCNFCDTKYHDKGTEMSISEVYDKIKSYNTKKIIFTGGEPLLQSSEIQSFITHIMNVEGKNKRKFEIETNGTQLPAIGGLFNTTKKQIIQFNVSPKLYNSGNITTYYSELYKETVIDEFIKQKSTFKFVVGDEKDVEAVCTFVMVYGIKKENVYLMPKGERKSKQEKLTKNVIEKCLTYGFNFSPRLHVLIWDKKKGV